MDRKVSTLIQNLQDLKAILILFSDLTAQIAFQA